MIIVGDIACPTAALSIQLQKVFLDNSTIFNQQLIILNLEGLFGSEALLQAKVPVLYNHPSVLDAFSSFSNVTACLANNHILDIPKNFDETIIGLQQKNIQYGGAGNTLANAHTPIYTKDGKHDVIVFNECWDFLLYHQKNPTNNVYVATIQFNKLVKRVKECKQLNANATIVIYVHWSIDFETLPYPMYRQFAQDLITAGAKIVAGCHAHCVQGGEQFMDGYIVYGLGNFFLPNNVFANGNLISPAFAATQLVLEYNIDTNSAICHWFNYQLQNNQHQVNYIQSNLFKTCTTLKKYTPYQAMGTKEYIAFFKKNRRKKILIPLFQTYTNTLQLQVQTNLLKARAKLARILARVNIIKWGS
jgi:poly-gamma-glutamate synthesis protein (capsule biosynthesis protein)